MNHIPFIFIFIFNFLNLIFFIINDNFLILKLQFKFLSVHSIKLHLQIKDFSNSLNLIILNFPIFNLQDFNFFQFTYLINQLIIFITHLKVLNSPYIIHNLIIIQFN